MRAARREGVRRALLEREVKEATEKRVRVMELKVR